MASSSQSLVLCTCSTCIQLDPSGVLQKQGNYRRHQLRDSREAQVHDVLRTDTPTGSCQATLPQHGHPMEALLPSPTSRSIAEVESLLRLTLQGWHYELCERITSIPRPRDLDFTLDPASILSEEQETLLQGAYHYNGVLNGPPFTLTAGHRLNSAHLRMEGYLLGLIQKMDALHLQSPSPQSLSLKQAIREKGLAKLGTMHWWKQEIWWARRRAASFRKVVPTVETDTYLEAYKDPSRMPPEVLPGLLLVLLLNLVFHVPEKPSLVVLAALRTQIRAFRSRIGEVESQRLEAAVPRSVEGVLAKFDLDPSIRKFISCSKCFAIQPLARPYPMICVHQPAHDEPPCGARLLRKYTVKGENMYRPFRIYVHQDFQQWLARFLCRPDIEKILDSQKERYRSRGDTNGQAFTILDGEEIRNFRWPDNKTFWDCPSDEFRLFFALSGDGFNPLENRTAKQNATSTGIYLFCLNLPLSERQKPENVYLAGVIPGPHKPSTSQINFYMQLIVDDFRPFWETGVRYTRTCARRRGALARAAVIPVLSDALALRQMCGFGSTTSTYFCTCCYLPIQDIENVNKASWPQRELGDHKFWADQWNRSGSKGREIVLDQHGIRYTPLLELPYFNPIKFSPPDTMHNLFLGLFQRHVRRFWGMDVSLDDGDGQLRPKLAGVPRTPSQDQMTAGRIALGLPGLEFLKECRKDVLFHLCWEHDLRRGGKRRDLVRALAAWRTSRKIENRPQKVEHLVAQGFKLTLTQLHIVPLSILKAMCKAKGLTPILVKKTIRREDCVAALAGLRFSGQSQLPTVEGSFRKEKRKNQVVLGKALLAEVAKDRENLILPPWVRPAPAGAGSKGRGKLSADQWHSLCTIHLPITLIRLWGHKPPESREYQMLCNFIDLANAVEIACQFVTSPQHRSMYDALMTRYLQQAKKLYKEATITPNHHIALHVSDYQKSWGPSPETRGFSWEKYNRTLQLMNINNRFGDIELSFMSSACRKANLLALISTTETKSAIQEMYETVQIAMSDTPTGHRLHLPALEDEAPKFHPIKARKKSQLTPGEVAGLVSLLNSEGNSYVPSSQLTKREGEIFLYPDMIVCHTINEGGVLYKPFWRSVGASYVLLHPTPNTSLPYQPARIQQIFRHRRMDNSGSVIEETFCIVHYMRPLPETLVRNDFFRRFGHVGGGLWLPGLEQGRRVIRSTRIMSHFGKTEMELSVEGLNGHFTHVYPLDRLRTRLAASGVPLDIDHEGHEDIGELEDDDDEVCEDELMDID